MRIISLCPSLTKLVFDLGRGDQVVGVTKFCIRPAEKVAAIPKLGGTKNPQLDRIIELAPNLVLLNQEENRREDADALAAAGIPIHVSFPLTVDDAEDLILELGDLLDRKEQARSMTQAIQIARGTAHKAVRARVSWAYLIWRKPWMAVNGSTYIHHLLSEVGGANVFANAEDAYPEITPEELAAADPGRILLSSEPFPFKEKHLAELAAASGLEADRFHLVDGELLSWHGAHTAAGLTYATQLFCADLGEPQ